MEYQRIASLVAGFRENTASLKSYWDELLAHIQQWNPTFNALTSIQTESIAERIQFLSRSPQLQGASLFGVPVVIKENIQKKGFPVECASRMLKGYKGQYDATVVKLLEEAGAIIIGTANMDEFAMGSANHHSTHGWVHNPHNVGRVSGGSSGGSAAACAARFAHITLGSDTGGSVREPASFCGIVGFKPTYGRVSRYGLVAFGSSLDHVSPFTLSAEDLDITMQVLGKHDPLDSTSLKGSYISRLNQPFSLKGVRIGIVEGLGDQEGVEPAVSTAFFKLKAQMESEGAQFISVKIPHLEHALSVYYLIACAEASSNLARFDGIRYGHRGAGEDLYEMYCKSRSEGFGSEVKRRILLGTFALSAGQYDAYYGKAEKVREALRHHFAEVFAQVDFVYLPTTPSAAFPHDAIGHDPVKEYLNDIFTTPANLVGVPALSVPAAVEDTQLPLGLQFLAPWEKDGELLALAHYLEQKGFTQTTPWNPSRTRNNI